MLLLILIAGNYTVTFEEYVRFWPFWGRPWI